MRRILSLLLVSFALLCLSGCGGDGGSSPQSDRSFDVDWAARSRAIEGPSAALSFRLTLVGAAGDGSDFIYDGARNPSRAEAHIETYHIAAALKPITTTMRVNFYAGAPAGTGAIVGTAQAMVDLSQSRFVGTVSTSSRITSVAVAPQQMVPVGGAIGLGVVAKDNEGNVVPVSPGSATWTSDNTTVVRFQDGEAVGVATGTANVRATINGVQSAPVAVTVAALTYVQVFSAIPDTAPYSAVFVGQNGQTIPLAADLRVGAFSSLKPMVAQTGEVRITQNGVQRSARTLTFTEDARTSIVIAGTPDHVVIASVAEKTAAIASGKFRLRFVLGTVASGQHFDVYVLRGAETVETSTPIRTNVPRESGFVTDLDFGATKFAVTAPGSKTVLFQGAFTSPEKSDVTLVLDETSVGVYRYQYWGVGP